MKITPITIGDIDEKIANDDWQHLTLGLRLDLCYEACDSDYDAIVDSNMLLRSKIWQLDNKPTPEQIDDIDQNAPNIATLKNEYGTYYASVIDNSFSVEDSLAYAALVVDGDKPSDAIQ